MKQTMLPILVLTTRLWLILALLGSFTSPTQASHTAELLPAPKLISPLNGDVIFSTPDEPKAIPAFRWQPVKNAVKYEIQVSTTSDFRQGSLVYDRVTTSSDSWIPSDIRLPDETSLWWRVRAVDAAGIQGVYAAPQQFQKNWRLRKLDGQVSGNAPELLFPADLQVLTTLDAAPSTTDRPGFSWTAVFGATLYRLELSSVPSFEPVLASFTTVSTSFQLPQRLADAAYYWRVIPLMERGPDAPPIEGQPSEPRQISFRKEVSGVPVPLSPSDGVQLAQAPALSWSPVVGASSYSLQYSTSQTFPETADTVTSTTNAVSYTPERPLSNHQTYYWRVRVVSGLFGSSSWSSPRHFSIKWFPKVQLLTPVDGYPYTADPYLSWSPAEGAVKYRVEWSTDSNFAVKSSAETIQTYFVENTGGLCPTGAASTLFWKVIPIDSAGNEGEESEPFQFTCSPEAQAPVLVYPLYFSESGEVGRVPLPAFHWKRLLKADGVGGQHQAYRVQVSSSEDFAQPLWTMATENMSAVPLNLPAETYFWRVRPLEQVGGPEVGQWSQTWKMNYDPSLLKAAEAAVELLRPARGSEWVETLPLFEWLPQQGAKSYQVQLSRSPDLDLFTARENLIFNATTELPAYSYPVRLGYGTYYWRVQGLDAFGKPLFMGWSAPSYFEVAAQNRFKSTSELASANQFLVTGPQGEVDPNYDLTDLIVTQRSDRWYFNFKASTAAENMHYMLYLDLDQKELSGGDKNPDGCPVTTIPTHQPEFVINIHQKSTSGAAPFLISNVVLHHWKGTTWGWPMNLGSIANSAITYQNGRVELVIDRPVLEINGTPGSVSVAMFTVKSLVTNPGNIIDTLPEDNLTSEQVLRNFVTLTNRVSLIDPAAAQYMDSQSRNSFSPLTWHPPVEAPVCSYQVRVQKAMPASTQPVVDQAGVPSSIYGLVNDLEGNGTYQWQVRATYASGDHCDHDGGWSKEGSFTRLGPGPEGLTARVEQSTAQFSWSNAAGAEHYSLQIASDVGFKTLFYERSELSANSHTPTDLVYQDGVQYYWRVKSIRPGGIEDNWSAAQSFVVTRPQPTNRYLISAEVEAGVHLENPTVCWAAVLGSQYYRVQFANDAKFTTGVTAGKTVQNCYTPTAPLPVGKIYWRVAVVDALSVSGKFSPGDAFQKQYRAPAPVTPQGRVNNLPLFAWTPIEGAAGYRLEILNPLSRVVLKTFETKASSYRPSEPLNLGSYIWRVAAVDSASPLPSLGLFSSEVLVQSTENRVYLPSLVR